VPRGARGDSRVDTAIAVACATIALVLLVLPDGPRDRVAAFIRGNLTGPLAVLQTRALETGARWPRTIRCACCTIACTMRSQRLSAVEAENSRLRELLGLGRALRWGFVPAEALVTRGGVDEHTLLLSAGATQGVQRLSAVVSAEGLVGMVQDVDARTSVAIVWPHPGFRVSATTPDGGAFGIVTAHEGQGADRWMLELTRRAVPLGTALRHAHRELRTRRCVSAWRADRHVVRRSPESAADLGAQLSGAAGGAAE
jgi:hypothetical protein